jgi:hypothetical protein
VFISSKIGVKDPGGCSEGKGVGAVALAIDFVAFGLPDCLGYNWAGIDNLGEFVSVSVVLQVPLPDRGSVGRRPLQSPAFSKIKSKSARVAAGKASWAERCLARTSSVLA